VPTGTWSPATKRWWRTWADSAQAQEFTGTDWMRLEMLLPLVEQYFAGPDRFLMAEIRATESKLGSTVEDRKRMRLKIEKPRPGSTKDYYAHLEEDE